MRKTRRVISKTYNGSFLQYGFAFISENNEHRPLLFALKKVLASESLKSAKLKRHLHTKHDSHRNRAVEFFHRFLRTSKRQRQSFETKCVNEGKHTQASFEASLSIANRKKLYNIGEIFFYQLQLK